MTKTITATAKEVRKFGLMFAALCVAAGGLLLFRGSVLWPWFAFGAGFFLISGLVGYQVLRPIYVGWMKFAFALGWINTRLLLSFFFYFILTPLGLAMKLFGKSFLEEKLEPETDSYWKKRTKESNRQTMEQQF